MPRFFAPLDLNWAEVRNAVTQNLATAPVARVTPGLRYYNTVTNDEQYWNGTRWVALNDVIDSSKITGLGNLAYLDQVGTVDILPGSITDVQVSTSAAIQLSKLAVNPLDRANHTGVQLAATISNFDTQVRTNPINLLATPTASLSMGSQIITNVGTPSLPSDATTKAYVDSIASGIDIHPAVRVATTANIDVNSAPATIDGVTLFYADRVVVKDQVNGVENGIYYYNALGFALVRAADADVDGDIRNGTYALVMEGTLNSHSGWVVTTLNPITIGTTSITWAQFASGGSNYVGTPNRITVTGNQIDIAATYVGQDSLTTLGTITDGTWHGTPIDIAHGGTGATTGAGARAALGTIGKMTAAIGDGISTQYDVTHNFNTMAVGVELYELQTGQTVYADVVRLTPNIVRIEGFVNPPALNGGTGSIGVVVWG